jgi:hypothetical protein
MISISQLLEQENQVQIYCDMDGVLTDFNESAKKIGWKGPLPAVTKEDKSALWKMVVGNAEKFWGDMPWKEDGKILWEFIKPYDPILLTSVANSLSSKLGSGGKRGKERWVGRELGRDYVKNNLIVVASHGKTKYAKKGSILIDDFEKNIIPWESAGGIGILHTSADRTIDELKKLLQ